MVLLDRHDRYGAVSIVLHWALAASMLLAWLFGQLGDPRGAPELFQLHNSFGLLALVFALALVIWRLFVSRPEPVVKSPLERILARTVQAGLLAVAIAAPLSGIVALQSEGRPVRFFGIEVLSGNAPSARWLDGATRVLPTPAHADEDREEEEHAYAGGYREEGEAGEAAEELHELLVVPLFLLLLGLHVAGVAKHHLIDRVPVVRRMLGRPALPAAG